ncbi:Uma2 family endonuclease [Candidatus Synechococcus calcipolaris G9]|uniref:Uma2 family endonuclease n=1 Tax=Candidatus Synechococcus calcipolaris G9 TaxID=1497997 RepID=A0ABT6EVN8_9SYNE|nr:Uma2 family endonuclease [Candidatus Synechococcus calcipolaris]MDG2989859.1 Uma2 family endonuclease [Candidatus Synechococcus calcipolaris G9]
MIKPLVIPAADLENALGDNLSDLDNDLGISFPDANDFITEDDTPVDNIASEKQQRLLTAVLYSNLTDQRFLAAANVGIYHTVNQPAIVPDVFVSFNVEVPEDFWPKENRCYFLWNFGKPPDIAIEVVSNRVGNELTHKFKLYEQMRVSYYVVFDPMKRLGGDRLGIFELRGLQYQKMQCQENGDFWLGQVNLGLTLWDGEFEGGSGPWLRWCDAQGQLLPTGDEQAHAAQAEAKQAKEQARNAQEQAAQAQAQAQRLADFLRSQGIDPDQLPG